MWVKSPMNSASAVATRIPEISQKRMITVVSGQPTSSDTWCAALARTSAIGSAKPTSSAAQITMRRVIKRGSSPPAIIRASQ